MNKNTIIQNADFRGRFIEGTLATGFTPLPGTAVRLTSSGTYNLANAATTVSQPIVILQEDAKLGKTVSDAYADGARFLGCIPVAGDEVLTLLTGNQDPDSGEQISIAATGLTVSQPSATTHAAFTVLETIVNANDGLALCRVN